jgi:hypothetical protein
MALAVRAFAPALASALTVIALGPAPTSAQADGPASTSNDYSDGASWLCRPGRDDACAVDLSTTVVAADGTVSPEPWSADPDAPIDCFYVYPTVSTDSTTNSDMSPDAAERRVVEQQFARFASVCRPFAPSYRQVTLAGLRARMAGGGTSDLGRGLAYDDVRDAFRHYLENDNQGRGFVLVGHSQGSYVLTRLIGEEIDGQALQDRLVSALLLGATVTTAPGRDVGGSFRDIPLCRMADQTGCVVTYVSFRATAPPPENTLFGRASGPEEAAACTNPAALGGGNGALRAYLSAGGNTIVGARRTEPWVRSGPAIETPFVTVPGLLTAECVTNEHATYLQVTVHGDPSDPRVDDIAGDLTPQWGLHLVDVNLAMGNLIDVVREQGAAWEGRHGSGAPTLTVPHFSADDPRVGTAGFVGQTTRLSFVEGETTYTLMAFAVGDVLTLGAMVEGPFDGTAEWRVGGRSFSVPVTRANRGSDEVPVTGAEVTGRHGGFRDFDWVNVEVPLDDWLPDGTVVGLSFRAGGRSITLPEGGGVYASEVVTG